MGKSCHNQRIERQWGDVNKATSPFVSLFKEMQLQGLLDTANEVDIFALHLVFLPRIQNALDRYISMWNHHKIRTARNMSPELLFKIGVAKVNYKVVNLTAELLEWYGVEIDEETEETEEEMEGVPVEEPRLPVNDVEYSTLQEIVAAGEQIDGIVLYRRIRWMLCSALGLPFPAVL
jgi:hypothetical protein